MSDQTTKTTPRPSSAEAGADRRRKYEPPTLVDYGDIATLTQTGGLTTKDQGSKQRRIG
jgi:hypothetical protein